MLKLFTKRSGLSEREAAISIAAIYLMLGYSRPCDAAADVPEYQAIFGHLSVSERLSQLALVVVEFMASPRATQLGESHPGVFEYEVLEALGTWFAVHSTCTNTEFRQQLELEFRRFMAGGTPPAGGARPPAEATRPLLQRVLAILGGGLRLKRFAYRYVATLSFAGAGLLLLADAVGRLLAGEPPEATNWTGSVGLLLICIVAPLLALAEQRIEVS